jgi:hypothetical protein
VQTILCFSFPFGEINGHAVLPDNTTVDATVYAAGNDYYSFSVTPSAVQLPIEISVFSPPATNCFTPNNDWVVLKGGSNSFVTLKADYPDTAVLNAIIWNVGQSRLAHRRIDL